MWAGRTFENQGFSQILPFKGFIFKVSTSGGKKWRDFWGREEGLGLGILGGFWS